MKVTSLMLKMDLFISRLNFTRGSVMSEITVLVVQVGTKSVMLVRTSGIGQSTV